MVGPGWPGTDDRLAYVQTVAHDVDLAGVQLRRRVPAFVEFDGGGASVGRSAHDRDINYVSHR
ncbi:hypothetical protein GA0070624_0659 [Micromonospora rhizosphaerae]|uniref:Uncharacterized protein n=1 Tax=Micromonospora rhizosphaerae TaxID=568872 RepID=A0A1C6RE41_9ACTN|nr:hypothetical protein [Micromonospora rhizosphaerae]SCL15236.1 hypothetical protein GA0070624_0659 [Micromonospora rhizosphaerae]